MGKLVRTKVLINKSSLEQLVELNEQAQKVDCAVLIGVLPKGEAMLGGTTMTPIPFYMVLEQGMITEKFDALGPDHVALTKEEALTRIIGHAKHRGV